MPHGRTTALLLGGGSSRSSISCGEARRGEHLDYLDVDDLSFRVSMSRRPTRQQSPPPPLAVHLAVLPPRGALGTT